jgi:hypothetical protein
MGHERSKYCVGCGIEPPPMDDNSTLVSMKHGWRLTRTVDADGTVTAEWRCKTCWVRHRKEMGLATSLTVHRR